MDSDGAMGSIECAICLSYPLDAKELDCCEQIICGGCISRVSGHHNQTCPLCRKQNFKAHPVRGALKRLLESATIPCPNECGSNVAVGNLKDHNKTCPKQPMDCKFCNKTFVSNNFMEHLQSKHATAVKSMCMIGSEEESTKSETGQSSDLKSQFPKRNPRNNFTYVEFGMTGKFYCGRRQDFDCGCCDGNCGPDNGCNCTSCQAMDIEYRKVPAGYYVNSAGFVCYRDQNLNKFYCLRKLNFGRNESACDGAWGNSCDGCMSLNRIWSSCAVFRNINPPPRNQQSI